MLNLKEIEKELIKKEEAQDEIIKNNREIVRITATSIKELHAGNIENAKKLLLTAEKKIKPLLKEVQKYNLEINHILQEYCEAKILVCIIEQKEIPSNKELEATPEAYVGGLLDCIGELKRQMFECLRKGKKKKAEYFFNSMEKIYDELFVLKFSNALLPDFRRKQDKARIQIEQARGELL